MSPRGRAYGAAAALLPHPPLGQESFRSRVRPPAHGPRAKARGEGRSQAVEKKARPGTIFFPGARTALVIDDRANAPSRDRHRTGLQARLKAQGSSRGGSAQAPSPVRAAINAKCRHRPLATPPPKGGSAIFGGIATDKACNRSLAPALCIGLMHRPYALALCIGLMHVMFRRAGAGPTSKPWPINPGP